MTKHLPVDIMLKHMAALNMEFPVGRTSFAPSLNLLHQAANSRSEWIGDEVCAKQSHAEPRWRLFAPSRINGEPPINALMPIRFAEGILCGSGK